MAPMLLYSVVHLRKTSRFWSRPQFSSASAYHGHIIEPSRSQKEAEDLFSSFHRRNLLAPSNLLETSTISLVFIPFWTFSVHANAVYTAAVGTGVTQLQSGQAGVITRDMFSQSTQVPATYHIRPDLASGLKPSISHVPGNSWHSLLSTSVERLAQELAGELAAQPSRVLPATMHRGIAWELVLRSLRAEEEPRILAALQGEHSGKRVRDVHMTLECSKRSSNLVFVPGYLFDYTYGEVQDDSLEVAKQHHQALVPAAGAAAVFAEPHYSPPKAQAAAMAAVLGAQAAWTAGSAALTPGAMSVDALRATSVDMAFWAFLAASAAGVAARGFTQYLRDSHTSGVEEQAESLHAAYMRDGASADTVEEPHDLRVRADAEWLRWLEAEKWSWRPARRKQLAERLFAEQAMRRQLSERAARRRAEEKRMFETHAQQHAWKRAQYGESERSRVFAGGKRAGGRFDMRGHYKRLGITEEQAQGLTAAEMSETVKQAYRRQAKRLHPDRHRGLPAEQHASLQAQFQELQTAYQVLRDEEKRKVYDAGGHVES